MEVCARHMNAAISAQKVRLVADQIRGMSAEKATLLLKFSTKKAAKLLKKVLDSAVANAENNNGFDLEDLLISTVYIDEGPRAKRFRARARGRGNQILKRSCHITIKLSDGEQF